MDADKLLHWSDIVPAWFIGSAPGMLLMGLIFKLGMPVLLALALWPLVGVGLGLCLFYVMRREARRISEKARARRNR